MKHIVIDARIIATPTGRYVVKLLDYLQEVDTDNKYTILVKPKDIDYYKPTNKNFSIKACPYKEFTFSEQIGFWFFLHKLKPDLVHFTQFHQPIFYRKPKVTTIHDLIVMDYINKRDGSRLKVFYKHKIKPVIFKVAIKLIANWSDHIIAITNYTKNDVIKRLNPKTPVSMIYEGADVVSGKGTRYAPIGNQPFITFVGNTAPYKNLQNLIRAMPKINEETGAKLLVVGKENDFTDWLRGIADKEASDLVQWTGFVSDEELKWLYQNTLVHAVPSLFEGFGLGGLEAIAYKTPVVAADNTCMPEVYGDAAHYFNPHSIDDIAIQTIKAVKDKELRQKLKKAAPKQIAKYSWMTMAEETHAVYKKYL